MGLTLIPLGVILYYVSAPFDKNKVLMNRYSRIWAFVYIYGNFNCPFEVEGLEKIEKGKTYVIIANHNSFFDINMIQLLPINLRWVSKKEATRIPFVGWIILLQASITVKRGDKKSASDMMRKGKKMLQQGVSLTVFPEGTRSKDGKVGEFKPGAFLLAKSAGVDILPVMLYSSREGMESPITKRVTIKLKILDAVDINSGSVKELNARMHKLYTDEFNSEDK